MKKLLILSIAVLGSFYGQAQHDKKHLVNKKVKTAIETGVFDGVSEPTTHEETEFYDPVPTKVDPYGQNGVPSDAIVLFDGSNMEAWEIQKDGSECTWKLDKKEKSMSVSRGGRKIKSSIVSKRKFGAVQLHLEWRSPAVNKKKTGQTRGNSGVAFDERYEIQILDNNNNDTYVNGMVGSVYKQSAPLVNPTLATGKWNSYDIIYHPPVFEGEKRVKKGTMTVFENGVLIQDHFSLLGTTAYVGWPKQPIHGKGSIRLQEHGSAVSFRNIWVRELKK